MTRYRVTFSGMTLLALAASAALDANAQKVGSPGNATMRNSSGAQLATCANYQLTIGADGSLDVTCLSGSATPPPTPPPSGTPPPTPPPTQPPTGGGTTCVNSNGDTITTPSNIVMQTMFVGGSINYVFDSSNYVNNGQSGAGAPSPGSSVPMNTIQVFELPRVWSSDNSPITHAHLTAGDYVLVNNGSTYEVAFSKCKGDFSYYQSASASYPLFGLTFRPCGIQYGPNYSLDWGTQGDPNTCQIPANETWYLNWRVVAGTCPTGTGHTCGHIFNVTR